MRSSQMSTAVSTHISLPTADGRNGINEVTIEEMAEVQSATG